MANKRGSWNTGYGFYILAIGSACGLGNLWRFPYVVGENGGGAFILLYGLMAFAIGAPILIAELLLGKNTGKSVIVATRQMSQKTGKKYLKFVGPSAVLMSLIVFSYYSVISGWVLHYVTQFLLAFITQSQYFSDKTTIGALMDNGWLQVMLASVHILITVVMVLKGIQKGLEKWLGYMMVLFIGLVIILVMKALSLSSMPEVLRFLFYPDFSKLTWSSLNYAIGQVFFALSVGFGTMVTFGSYMREGDHVPTAGFRVTVVDIFVSIVGAIIIFPVAFQASNSLSGDPTLMFKVLPTYLYSVPGGALFGLAFFVCLYFAALNASIGLLEVIVSNLLDTRKKLERSKATWSAGGIAFVISIIPALSSSVFSNVQVGGRSLIVNIDSLLINWLLPVIALGILLAYSFGTSDKEKEQNFIDKNKFVSFSMYPHWRFIVRWGGIIIILLGLILQVVGFFKIGP